MEHQDWQPIVFYNNKSKSKSNDNVIKKQKKNLDENGEESIIIKKPTVNVSLMIMKGRDAKGLKTQKELALKTNGKITEQRIKQLESRSGPAITGTEKSILNRILSVKL